MDAPRTPESPLPFAPDSPWGRCLTHYLATLFHRSGSAASQRKYRATLTAFFARVGRPPDACSREDILSFIYAPCYGHYHRGKPPGAGTVNGRLAILSSFYAFATTYTCTDEQGALQRLFDRASPTAGLHAGQTNRAYRAFSFAELERFFAVIAPDTVQGKRDRALFLCYLWTARRISEIAELCLGDIEQAIMFEGGRQRDGWLYHFRNKGHKSVDDSAELPRPAKEAIDRYLDASGRRATMTAASPIFVAVGGRNTRGTPLAPHVIHYLFKRYVRLAGLDGSRLTVHSFRHTAARERFLAGSDLLEIQQLLRHQNLATTAR